MSLDVSLIVGEARARYVMLGKGYGSPTVIDQGRQTLAAMRKHAAPLAGHGLIAADADDLESAVEQSVAAGGAREGVRTEKGTASSSLADAMVAAKSARVNMRRVGQSALRANGRRPGTKDAAFTELDTALDASSRQPRTGEKLAQQIDALAATLAKPAVAGLISTRGGEGAAARGAAAATALRTALEGTAQVPGTPTATELLDLLDGIIIELCREARSAARAYADESGDAAVAAELELTKLDRPSSSKKPAPPNP